MILGTGRGTIALAMVEGRSSGLEPCASRTAQPSRKGTPPLREARRTMGHPVTRRKIPRRRSAKPISP